MLSLLLFVVSSGLFLYYYATKNYDYWRKRKVPSPRTIPFFGNMASAALLLTTNGEALQKIYNDYRDHPYVGIFGLRKPILLLRDPKLIKLILVKEFAHFQGRGMVINKSADPLGEHLISLIGPRWRVVRTKLTPVFTSGKIRNIFGLIADTSQKFKEYVKNIADDEKAVEFRDLTTKFTLEVISTCCFGFEADAIQDEDPEFRVMCRKVLDADFIIAVKRIIRLYMPAIFRIFNMTLNPPHVAQYFIRIVKDMISYRENNNIERQDFLQLLIELKRQETLIEKQKSNGHAAEIESKESLNDAANGAEDVDMSNADLFLPEYIGDIDINWNTVINRNINNNRRSTVNGLRTIRDDIIEYNRFNGEKLCMGSCAAIKKSSQEPLILKNHFIPVIDDNVIVAQAYVFFLAGSETSSATMSFALYELAANPDIQERLRNEIRAVLERHGSLCYDAISEMEYLDCVIRETLRKHTPVQVLPRVCNEAYRIPDTDLVIEKGMQVLVPVYAIHHDPAYYEEPEKFNPDRFLNANRKDRESQPFLSFGDGPRVCIGMRFAYVQAKAGIVAVLSDYEVKLSSRSEASPKYDPTANVLAAKSGIWLTVHHRRKPPTTTRDGEPILCA